MDKNEPEADTVSEEYYGEVFILMKEKGRRNEATIAPGMEDNKGLGIEASQQDIKEGNTTNVTIVSLDEADPS
ncbi:hypothetical protein AM500_11375 [Bacillus sp. FJAT-18017]|uniref:hypothetical protein n=1 Tax=Bacillus sp. FJAT-18017 TaxID=1705566 RepID=UPI0006AEAEC7|nr:hypothetical protein [Bacillus sp. FJAT-18017]ALC90317.1 hypothetical protein AM500_11375 [Bacillus sp. FJAT-18017]